MSLLQVYYTSCRNGLRGSPGFQVHAASAGIAPAVLQQVERLCVYVPPVSAPSRPGPDELEQFPLSLIYQQLPDNTAVLGQARYVGADYSGRFGNYFAHSLVTATLDADLGELLPIQLWRSPQWQKTEVDTTELPVLGRPVPGSACELPQIFDFLQHSGRMEHVAAFLTAIEQALQTRRRVVIVDSSDAVASWIAVACYVLPRSLALRLTFNTYVKSPYQTDALVVGTTADSDFGFAPHEIRHTVFLFDFVGGRFTPIEEASPLGKQAAAVYRAGRPQHLAGYGAFAAAVAPELPLTEAAVALAAFCRLAGISEPAIDAAQIAAWCGPRLARIAGEQVGPLCAQLVGDTASSVSVALTLMQAAMSKEVSAQHQAAVCRVAVNWLVRVALRAVSNEDLAQLISALAPMPELKAAAQSCPLDWAALLHSTQEPARLLSYVRLGDYLGGLAGLEGTLTDIGEKVVGPALQSEPVQASLQLLAGMDSGPPLLSGIATFLTSDKDQNPEKIRPLYPLLAHEQVSAELQVWALKSRALVLYFHVYAARARSEKLSRVEAFKQCLGGAASAGETLTGALVDSAISIIWFGGLPAPAEALQVVCEVSADVLAQSDLPARLAERLAQATNAIYVEDAQRELAVRLGDPILRESLGPKVDMLDLFDAAMRLSKPDWAEHLVSALRCADQVGLQQGEGVRRLAAERIADEQSFPRHETLVRSAFAASSMFGQAYRVVMEGVAQGNPKMEPPRVVGLLRCWLALEESPEHHAVGALLLNRVLPEAVRGWGRKERAAAKAALLQERAVWSRLHAIFVARSKRRRLALWISGLLVMLLATAVTLWLASGHKSAAPLLNKLRRVALLHVLLPLPKAGPDGTRGAATDSQK